MSHVEKTCNIEWRSRQLTICRKIRDRESTGWSFLYNCMNKNLCTKYRTVFKLHRNIFVDVLNVRNGFSSWKLAELEPIDSCDISICNKSFEKQFESVRLLSFPRCAAGSASCVWQHATPGAICRATAKVLNLVRWQKMNRRRALLELYSILLWLSWRKSAWKDWAKPTKLLLKSFKF